MEKNNLPERIMDAVLDPRWVHWFPRFAYRRMRYRNIHYRNVVKKLVVCFTFDVEGNLRDALNPRAAKQFMPRFLEWAIERRVRATLYIQASLISDLHRDFWKAQQQHELGLHGFNHEVWGRARWWQSSQHLDPLPKWERKHMLEKAVEEFDKYNLERPTSFRAPYLNADRFTLDRLTEMGFRTDSSAPTYLGALPIPKHVDGLWHIPLSAPPRVNLQKSLLTPFSFPDFSMGYLAQVDKDTFLNDVHAIVHLQNQIQSALPPHLVLLAHPWEFDDDGAVAHASSENFTVLDRLLDWLQEQYIITSVPIRDLVNS